MRWFEIYEDLQSALCSCFVGVLDVSHAVQACSHQCRILFAVLNMFEDVTKNGHVTVCDLSEKMEYTRLSNVYDEKKSNRQVEINLKKLLFPHCIRHDMISVVYLYFFLHSFEHMAAALQKS